MSGYKRVGVDIQKVKDIVLPLLEEPHKEFIEHELDCLNKLQIENLELNKRSADILFWNKKLQEENEKLQEEIKHKDNKFYEFCEENKKLREENDKLIDELECRYSTWETKEKEYEGELAELRLLVDKNTNIVEYLNTQLEKYKTTLQKLKTECDKVKGISVNKDNTKIKINDIELIVGDKFSLSNEVGIFELKEIYVGKTGKYSLRTDYKTIRLGNKFITGSVKILKE